MAKKKAVAELIDDFARYRVAQDVSIRKGDSTAANKYAKKFTGTFRVLVREYGDAGREALSKLFDHTDDSVRAASAAYLLRYKTDEALRVLRQIAAENRSIVGFGAKHAILRWQEYLEGRKDGWQLDLVDPEE